MGLKDFTSIYQGSTEIGAAYRGETQVFWGDTPAPSAPTNTVAPSITGTATVGQTLTAAVGTWTGSPSYARQWLRNGTAISGATGTTYLLIAADQGASISVRITATNAGGSAQATSAGVGPVAAAPTAPSQITTWTWTTGLAASQIVASITAPSDGGSAITGYEYSLDGGTTAIPLTGASPWTLTMAAAGTSYTAVVRARNAIGAGAWSTSKTATSGAAAATAPAQFGSSDWSVATGASASQVTLTVSALPSNGGSAITALQYTIDGGATWTALSGTGTGARTLTMAAAGTAYTFALRAVNAVGAGTASASKTATSGAAGVEILTSPYFATYGDSQVASTSSGLVSRSLNRALGLGQSGWSAIVQGQTGAKVCHVYGEGYGGYTTAQLATLAAAAATAAYNAGARWAFIVAGGNDGPTADVPTTIANLTTIYDAFTAAGLRIFTYLVPKNGHVSHLARYHWMQSDAVAQSAGYDLATLAAKQARWPGWTFLDVWRTLAASPDDDTDGPGINPLYSNDNTHLNAYGSRVLGEKLSELLAPYINSSFPVNALATTAGETLGGFATDLTTGGTITNNSTATVTGSIPTGMTAVIPAELNGLSIDFQSVINSSGFAELVIAISGRSGDATPATARGYPIVLSATALLDSSGNFPSGIIGTDAVIGAARVKIDSGSYGMAGVGNWIKTQGSPSMSAREYQVGHGSTGTTVAYPNFQVDTVTSATSGAGVAYDINEYTVLAPMMDGVETKTSRRLEKKIYVSVLGTGPVNATIRISQWSLLKRSLLAYPLAWN